MTQTPILIVPGRGNSGPGHWQTLVERSLPGTQRVLQADWESPSLEDWSRAIDRAVRALDHRPLLVAHSFGCLAAAYAQLTLGTPVGASLFVAPADPGRFALPRHQFAQALRQPGLLIASENDPWLAFDQALAFAEDWGIDYVNLGPAGHINIDSGHGRWPFGETIIAPMRQRLDETAGLAWPARRWATADRQVGHGA